MREQTKKRKNENRLPFFQFSFYARTNRKTEKRKSTSVLSLFVLCTNKREPWVLNGCRYQPYCRGRFYRRRGGGRGAAQKDRGSWRRECCSRSACALFCQWFWLVDSFGGLSAGNQFQRNSKQEQSGLLGRYSLFQDIAHIEL